MTTSNKLLESILLSGREQAQAIELEAKENAEKILSESRAAAELSKKEIEAETAVKENNLRNSAKSSAALISRNAVLQTKRSEITKTVDGICEYILGLGDSEYFELLYKMAATLKGESGELLVNSRDRDRLPSDFLSKMKAAGVDCTLSNDTADIIGGFILRNGPVESSLAINAVIEDKRSMLEDFINLLLFEKEA